MTSTPTATPTRTATATFAPTPSLPPFTGAEYTYDGDSRLVKATVNGVTTYYVSGSYQVTGSAITKYYGSYAMRANGTL